MAGLQVPRLDAALQTFIHIPVPTEEERQHQLSQIAEDARPDTEKEWWLDYMVFLRDVVGPLVHDLLAAGRIDWFCFKLHHDSSGGPLGEPGLAPYLHLRLAAADPADVPGLIATLPPFCRHTEQSDLSDADTIEGIVVADLLQARPGLVWYLLGMASELTLTMAAHLDRSSPEPVLGLAQARCYENQLYLSLLRPGWNPKPVSLGATPGS